MNIFALHQTPYYRVYKWHMYSYRNASNKDPAFLWHVFNEDHDDLIHKLIKEKETIEEAKNKS